MCDFDDFDTRREVAWGWTERKKTERAGKGVGSDLLEREESENIFGRRAGGRKGEGRCVFILKVF